MFQYLFCAALLLSTLCLTSCQNEQSSADGKTALPENVIPVSQDSSKLVNMKTERVQRRQLANDLHVPGRLQADVSKEIEISPRFSGRIVNILVKPGSHVAGGQVLAEVDSHDISELQAELVKANSELEIAKAHEERERQIYEENKQRPKNLIEAQTHDAESKVALDLAEADFERVESLFKEKIAPEKDFLATKANLARLKVAHKAAESELQRQQRLYQNKAMLRRDLQLAQAETARARQHVNTLKQRLTFLGMPPQMVKEVQEVGHIHAVIPIQSPVAGIVTEQNAASGEMIGPDKRLFTITDLTTVVVTADIPEVDLRHVRLGGPVLVKVAAYPEETFRGLINFISEQVNPQTRAVAIRAVLNNSDHRLKAHMFADIDVPGVFSDVLSCPRDAIQERDGKPVAYVATKGGYEERKIEIGKEFKNYVEVRSGLNEGDEVATQGSLLLKTAMSTPKRETHQ